MKLKYDYFIYSKILIHDAIIKFCQKFERKDISNISTKELNEFIECFFENKKM